MIKFMGFSPFVRLKSTVSLIRGTGVWPQLLDSVEKLVVDLKLPIKFEEVKFDPYKDDHEKIISEIKKSVIKNKICLKGIIRTPIFGPGLKSLNTKIRQELDLYATVVVVKSLPTVQTRHKDVDLVIIREQLEGEYSALEHESIPGVVESLKVITRKNSTRIAKLAFDYATRHGKSKVTAVHKANIMKLADGLFLETCKDVAKLFPKIKFESIIIDNCCMQLVSRPQQFEVMVMPNLYGNIVSNLAAGLIGGAGVVPGMSFSHVFAIFEPGARHVYSHGVGKDIANPTAILMCLGRLLRHINEFKHADTLFNALMKTYSNGDVLTSDVGGNATTTQFISAVQSNMS